MHSKIYKLSLIALFLSRRCTFTGGKLEMVPWKGLSSELMKVLHRAGGQ